eukprot:727584_1
MNQSDNVFQSENCFSVMIMVATVALLFIILHTTTESQTYDNETAHEEICLSRDGTVSSLLQGIFVDNGINREEYNTIEFISNNNENLDDPLYIWYHDRKWWLSPVDYRTKDNSDASLVDVYGYCIGGEIGSYPACEECWVFFWEVLPLENVNAFWEFKTKSFVDCSVSLSVDLTVCEDAEDSKTYDTDMEYPDAWCVNGIGNIVEYGVESLVGVYERRSADHYRHVAHPFYMWHDVMSNLWFIGLEYDASPVLLCRPNTITDGDHQTVTLSGCILWDLTEKSTVEMDDVLSITTECVRVKHYEKGMSTGVVIGIVCAIAFGIIGCALILYCGCSKTETEQKHSEIDMKETEMGPAPFTPDVEACGGQTKLQKKLSKLDTLDAQRFAHVPQETFDMHALDLREESNVDPLND